MIGLAWHTARARATSLAGSFVALALGVALLAAMALALASTAGTARHPRWFARAGVVVAGDDTVSVTSGPGDDRETQTATTVEARAVPPPSPRGWPGCPRHGCSTTPGTHRPAAPPGIPSTPGRRPRCTTTPGSPAARRPVRARSCSPPPPGSGRAGGSSCTPPEGHARSKSAA